METALSSASFSVARRAVDTHIITIITIVIITIITTIIIIAMVSVGVLSLRLVEV